MSLINSSLNPIAMLMANMFLLPIFMQELLGFSAVQSGSSLMPRVIAMMMAVPLVGRLYQKTSPQLFIAIGVVFLILAVYPGPATLYDWLAQPLVAHLPKGGTLIATNPISPFMVPIKVTMLAAFMLALPVVLYQVWAFVAPGLYTHEKRLR